MEDTPILFTEVWIEIPSVWGEGLVLGSVYVVVVLLVVEKERQG